AIDDIENPWRKAGLDQKLRKPHRHARITFGWLQDEGISACDGGRKLPHRNHGRKVERRDAGNDTQWLTHGVDVDAWASAFGVLALHEMRDAGCELHDLDAALDVALRVGDGLAVLA